MHYFFTVSFLAVSGFLKIILKILRTLGKL